MEICLPRRPGHLTSGNTIPSAHPPSGEMLCGLTVPTCYSTTVPHSIVWRGREQSKGDEALPCLAADGVLKAEQRFPVTGEGWAQAWQALTTPDPYKAQKVRAVLGRDTGTDRGLDLVPGWLELRSPTKHRLPEHPGPSAATTGLSRSKIGSAW